MVKAPAGTRVLIASTPEVFLGFAVDRKAGRSQIFRLDRSRPDHLASTTLPEAPDFFAYARDRQSRTFCVPFREIPTTTRLVCYDADFQVTRTFTFDGFMTSGAWATPGRLWVVGGDHQWSGRAAALMELIPGNHPDKWRKSASLRAPSCGGSDAPLDCELLEIHPGKTESELVVFPLTGRFDGLHFTYSAAIVWNPRAGTTRRIELPRVPVSESVARELAPLTGKPLRSIFRSAVSGEGRLGVIPVLPAPESEGPKHDQLWLHTNGKEPWLKLVAPGQAVAVGFIGELPFVVTKDGVVWQWQSP